MYSVVLMVALSGAGDAPAHGGLFKGGSCCGSSCSGCSGAVVVYSGCSGSSCSGWSGSGCCGGSSCCGGGGLLGGLFKGHKHKGGSCCGGYSYGGSCCGGSSYGGGCYGGAIYSGGGCYGGVSYSPAGVSYPSAGMPYAGGVMMDSSVMGAPVYPSSVVSPSSYEAPVVSDPMKKAEEKKADEKKKEEKKPDMVSTKATVVVNLPADAVLIVDGQKTLTTSARRVFTSPELEKGRDYYYDMKAEFKRDGKPVEVSKRIIVRAGAETAVDLNEATVSTVKK